MSGQHCENYDVKRETVHCYPRNVDRCCLNLSALFKICFRFVLLYNKSLNDWSLGEQWILFPSNLNVSLDFVSGNIEILGKQNSLFPSGPVIKCLLLYSYDLYHDNYMFLHKQRALSAVIFRGAKVQVTGHRSQVTGHSKKILVNLRWVRIWFVSIYFVLAY